MSKPGLLTAEDVLYLPYLDTMNVKLVNYRGFSPLNFFILKLIKLS